MLFFPLSYTQTLTDSFIYITQTHLQPHMLGIIGNMSLYRITETDGGFILHHVFHKRYINNRIILMQHEGRMKMVRKLAYFTVEVTQLCCMTDECMASPQGGPCWIWVSSIRAWSDHSHLNILPRLAFMGCLFLNG